MQCFLVWRMLEGVVDTNRLFSDTLEMHKTTLKFLRFKKALEKLLKSFSSRRFSLILFAASNNKENQITTIRLVIVYVIRPSQHLENVCKKICIFFLLAFLFIVSLWSRFLRAFRLPLGQSSIRQMQRKQKAAICNATFRKEIIFSMTLKNRAKYLFTVPRLVIKSAF